MKPSAAWSLSISCAGLLMGCASHLPLRNGADAQAVLRPARPAKRDLSMEDALRKINTVMLTVDKWGRLPSRTERGIEAIVNRIDWEKAGLGAHGRLLPEPEAARIPEKRGRNGGFGEWVTYSLAYAAEDVVIGRAEVVVPDVAGIWPAENHAQYDDLQTERNGRREEKRIRPFWWRGCLVRSSIMSKTWPWTLDPRTGLLSLGPIYWAVGRVEGSGPLSKTYYEFASGNRKAEKWMEPK